jgi:CrcB protein
LSEPRDHTTDGHHPGGQVPHHDLPVDPDAPEEAPSRARRRAAKVFRERWDVLLVIAAGGALGSLARWTVSTALPHAKDGFAWATFVENVTGGLVLGALMVLVLDLWPPNRYLRPFLGVGVLGGYTTFSTYMLDTHAVLAAGRIPVAFGYLAGTLVAGLAAVWAGVLAGRTAVVVLERRRQHRYRSTPEPGGQPDDAQPEPTARSRR